MKFYCPNGHPVAIRRDPKGPGLQAQCDVAGCRWTARPDELVGWKTPERRDQVDELQAEVHQGTRSHPKKGGR